MPCKRNRKASQRFSNWGINNVLIFMFLWYHYEGNWCEFLDLTKVVRSGDLVSYTAEEGVRILGEGKFLVSDSFPGNERTKYCLTSKVKFSILTMKFLICLGINFTTSCNCCTLKVVSGGPTQKRCSPHQVVLWNLFLFLVKGECIKLKQRLCR